MTVNEFDRDMSAATFAEAGEHETARKIMAGAGAQQKKPVPAPKKSRVMPLVIFGALSVGLYTGLFVYEDRITDLFTRGGVYTALPICSAFVFSFIYGAFASNLLSSLGLEAKKH